jgi:chromosome segregation protein
MRLRRLETYGFKSFADRMSFDFEDGITAIIGPNGCGKSNVVDAIKWVIGEQSAKALRGESMTDVIFNGCATRRGMPFAEVTLVLDQLPAGMVVDAPDVAITRRLTRDGLSSYFINGKACRLKDVKDLLMGTGMGTSAYAVIEQGRVGFILESNTKDRRLILEEAAGISRYRARRRIAARKLERVETDLQRIGEVLAEVRRRARQVRRQAQDAIRYRDLSARAKELRLAFALEEHGRLSGELDTLSRQLAELGAEDAAASAESASLEALVAEEDARLAPSEELIRARERERADAQSVREVARAQFAECEAQLTALDATEAEDRTALATVAERIATLDRSRREAEARLAEIGAAPESGVAAPAQAVGDRRAELSEAVQAVDALLARVDGLKSKQVECLRELSRIEAERKGLASAQEAVGERRRRLSERSGGQGDQILAAAAAVEAARRALEEAQRAAAEAHIALDADLRAREAAMAEVARLDHELAEIRHAEAKAETMLRVLTDHERRAEGVSRPVREVLREAQLPGLVGLVADLCRVPDDCVVAIETALGGAAQHIVTESVDDAKSAVEWLKRERRGRATFLPLDDIRGDERVDEHLLRQRGVVGLASRLVEYEARLRPVFEYLLGNVVVVETLDDAIALRRSHRPRCRMVTRDGEHINPSGAITGGRSGHAEGGGLVSRKSEIAKLTAELAELQGRRGGIATAREAARQESESCARRGDERRREIQGRDRAAGDARANLMQAERDRSHLEEAASSFGAELEEIALELGRLEGEGKDLAGQHDWFTALERKLDGERTAFQAELDAAAARRDRLQEEVNNLRVEAAAAREREEGARNHLVHLTRQQQELEDDRAERERRLGGLDARRAELLRRKAEAGAAREAANNEVERLSLAVHEAVAARDRLRQGTEELRQRAREAGARSRAIAARLGEANLRAGELRVRLEGLAQRVRDDHQLELAEAAANWTRPEDWDRDRLKSELEDTEAAIQRIGPVNLAAIDELQEAEAREAFIEKSHADLVEASEKLQGVIEQIDAHSRLLFEETYRQVRANFQALFRRLFGGGSADLRLERVETVTVTDPDGGTREVQREVDVLEAGLEIYAQPPGKNPKVITQLSGGEKALTAIALLFSVYQAKPSPFCILDEVDAPLDEANVDVYCNMVRDFTRGKEVEGFKGSQFIVITHKKRTMQRADAIYGITQNEPGVSTKISVKFDELASGTAALGTELAPTARGSGPFAG